MGVSAVPAVHPAKKQHRWVVARARSLLPLHPTRTRTLSTNLCCRHEPQPTLQTSLLLLHWCPSGQVQVIPERHTAGWLAATIPGHGHTNHRAVSMWSHCSGHAAQMAPSALSRAPFLSSCLRKKEQKEESLFQSCFKTISMQLQPPLHNSPRWEPAQRWSVHRPLLLTLTNYFSKKNFHSSPSPLLNVSFNTHTSSPHLQVIIENIFPVPEKHF